MQIATYDQWLQLKINQLKQRATDGEAPIAKWTCSECQGVGTIIDTGEITGQEFDADCPTCDGDGKIEFDADHVDLEKAKMILNLEAYTEELLADLVALAAHTKRHEWLVLAEHGFSVYSSIKTKKLYYEKSMPGLFYCKSVQVVH
jgi:hypothetical protein